MRPAPPPLFANSADFRTRDWTSNAAPIHGSHGTPETFELEARVARLEGGDHAVLCPSGLAAIALTYMALLRPGDELLVPVNVYPANRRLVCAELASWGIAFRLYDPTRLDTLTFAANTRLVWIEAACSSTFEFPDVREIVRRARAAGVRSALDSTWAAGVAFKPFDLGIDLAVQSLSKFACGRGDILMGSVSTRDRALRDELKLCAMRLGGAVSAVDAAAVLEGLETLPRRYREQDETTQGLVEALSGASPSCRVLHPGCADRPGHAAWRRDCSASAALFALAFEPEVDAAQVDEVVDSLRLFRIGFGWGDATSRALPLGRDVPGVEPMPGELVRFAVGREPAEALLADLRQALRRLA